MEQPIENEILHKEIDLIQACITRMAHNSFLIKGWCITIVAVVLALAEKAMNPFLLSAILLIPIVSFWYLDAFFLHTETMYRKMYSWVLEKRKVGDAECLYDLNPHRFKSEVKSHFKIMWSVTLRCFYGIPALIAVGIIAFSCCPLSKEVVKKDPATVQVLEIKILEPTLPIVEAKVVKDPSLETPAVEVVTPAVETPAKVATTPIAPLDEPSK